MYYAIKLKNYRTIVFVTLRKRIGKNSFDELNTELIKSLSKKADKRNIAKKSDKDNYPPNKGKLQADATVADQYIISPTDAKILNTSRKKLDEMIDKRYVYDEDLKIKPRTYRRSLDKEFLSYSKKKNKRKSAHRK